jgi:electron transfer flavoprotein alpha subunit
MAVAFIFGENEGSAAELVGLARGFEAGQTVLIAVGSLDGLDQIGADRAIVLKGASSRPEDYAHAIADIVGMQDDAVFLAPSSIAGREVAASVAGLLDCGMFSDVTALSADGERMRAERSVYGGAAVQTLTCALPCVATVGAGVGEAPAGKSETQVEERDVTCDDRIELVSVEPNEASNVDLGSADVVVCVGMGVDGEEDIALAQRLADAVGGVIGCTRDVAEGRKLMPKECYIGITGAVIKPSLYIGIGVSGQLQHVFGIRDAKVIMGINTDKEAPIFRAADYGIVGDLHDVVPKLIDALSA